MAEFDTTNVDGMIREIFPEAKDKRIVWHRGDNAQVYDLVFEVEDLTIKIKALMRPGPRKSTSSLFNYAVHTYAKMSRRKKVFLSLSATGNADLERYLKATRKKWENYRAQEE